MWLSYSEVVQALQNLNWISDGGAGAFRARLRKLQGEGIPSGANPGKGKRVEYSIPMIFELAIAVEFLQCGLSPSDAAGLIIPNRRGIMLASLLILTKSADPRYDIILLFSPEALRQFSVNSEDEPLGAITFVTRTTFVDLFTKRMPFEPVIGEPWRWLVIDLREVVFAVMNELESENSPRVKLIEALTDEIESNLNELQNFADNQLDHIVELKLPDNDLGNP